MKAAGPGGGQAFVLTNKAGQPLRPGGAQQIIMVSQAHGQTTSIQQQHQTTTGQLKVVRAASTLQLGGKTVTLQIAPRLQATQQIVKM